MFCPKCKSEYKQGIYRCADCQIELVKKLPEEESAETPDLEPVTAWVLVLETQNHADIAFIKSLLEEAGIRYYFQGELMHMTRRGLMQPVRLFVDEADLKTCHELLQDLDLNYWPLTGINPNH
jgi:hypothetical protein